MDQINHFIESVFEEQYINHFGDKETPESTREDLTLKRQVGDRLVAVLQAKCVLANAHITALVVDKTYQGQGLGASLIKEFEDLAQQRGLTSITLSTKSYQAEDFYRKMGYEVYATLEDVPASGMTKYHLIKRLSRSD